MNQNCSAGLYPNSLSSHASLLLSATPTIISSPMQAKKADDAAAADSHYDNNQNNNNQPNNSPSPTTTPTNATQNSPPLSPRATLRPSLNPLYQRRANNQRKNVTPTVFQSAASAENPLTPLAADLSHPITLTNVLPAPPGYLSTAPMPNYINFKKPQNEIFKKLDGKIQKIVAAHSNLNKLYALNDFPGLGATGGPKRQPFELPAQLPRPPPWVPKCSTSDDIKHHEDGIITTNASNTRCFSSSGSSPGNCNNDLDLGQPVYKRSQNSQANYKNQMVKKFLSQHDTKRQSGAKASFILDAAISKLHQRHQEQKLKEHQLKRIGTTNSITKLKLGVGPPSTHTMSVTHIRDISTSAPRPPLTVSSSPSSSLLTSTTTSQSNTDSSLSSADFTMLAEKIKETIDTQTFNIGKNANRTPEEGRKYQEAIMSKFKEQLYSLTKSIRLKIPPPLQSSASPTSPNPTINKDQKSILMKKSPQSLFKTIQRETTLLLDRRHSQKNARSSLSLLSDQQTYNRQNAHVKQAALAKTAPIYKPNSIRVIVPPTKVHYSLRFNNYFEEEIVQPTAELMTIEEFAKGLNLVRSNDASLQKHQEQLLQSNSNWINSSSNRPLRLRRIRGEKIRMPVSASYKAARKIGLQ